MSTKSAAVANGRSPARAQRFTASTAVLDRPVAPGTRTDVIVVGAGMAGMATAARLRARGLVPLVLEAHGQVGGCAGFYSRRGFTFDAGATTLVDFEPGGVGGLLMKAIGMTPPPAETLPGYVAWMPDRTATLHREPARWRAERRRVFGDTRRHRRFW